MKLDRNTNPDGKGKYALINLRDNTVLWGNESPGDQFFVLKYKDRFASVALSAYAKAAREAALKMGSEDPTDPQVAELLEFADEIDREARAAFHAGCKFPD